MAAIPPLPEPPLSALLPANVTLLQPATRYFRLMQALAGGANMPRALAMAVPFSAWETYDQVNAANLMPMRHLRRIV